MNSAEDLRRQAELSEDGQYRYNLRQEWDSDLPILGFLMLNPSTADASVDDPTVRKCRSIASNNGYGGMYLTNLFAYRAAKPKAMEQRAQDPSFDPVGPCNDDYISNMPELCDTICLAWGGYAKFRSGFRKIVRGRVEQVLDLLGDDLYCLCLNADGSPHHPLYTPAITGGHFTAWPAATATSAS